jgi:hypothetical protein
MVDAEVDTAATVEGAPAPPAPDPAAGEDATDAEELDASDGAPFAEGFGTSM